jgi:hypothetical protein
MPARKSPINSPRRLTPQQRLFADYVIEGKGKSEAYKLAYPQSSLGKGPLSVEAYRTAKLPHVADYIAEALAERRREVLLTRDAKRQILGSIARDPKAPRQARIMAVKVDNDMTGDAAPIRVEGEITLNSIFKALVSTTGLPAPTEREAIDVTATPQPTLEDELVPALERAG